MGQSSTSSEGTSTHGPVMADQLALELASGRVEYVAKLILATLTKDPYLRSPIADEWTWTQMRPLIQELVDRQLAADGRAARRWAEVSEAVSTATGTLSDPDVSATDLAHELLDAGTDLMNVLHLIGTERG